MPKTIYVPGVEHYDEQTHKFSRDKSTKLVLEHSLISLSKWEAKYKKPFLKEGSMSTQEEILDYIKFMTIYPQEPDPELYARLTQALVQEIVNYVNDPMTATWFAEDKKSGANSPRKKPRPKQILTAEVIYWEMIALNIPVQFEKWHLNRLLCLIRVCDAKNQPEKKLSPKEAAARRSALNAQRRAKHHSKG